MTQAVISTVEDIIHYFYDILKNTTRRRNTTDICDRESHTHTLGNPSVEVVHGDEVYEQFYITCTVQIPFSVTLLTRSINV